MMIFNSGRIGRKIALARKEKNLTQLELADYLGVRYQAVSNWERGQSMPDIEKLGDLAYILDLSLDDLLERPQAEAEITALQTAEKPIEEETLVQYAPIMKPKALATKLAETPVDLEHLKVLAPFLDSEVLSDLLKKGFPKSTSLKELVPFAPFLTEDQLQSWVNMNDLADVTLHFNEVVPLFPFLEEKTNDALFEKLHTTQKISPHELSALLPFVSSQLLGRLIGTDVLDFEWLQVAAPFLEQAQLTEIFKKAIATGNKKASKFLLPFVDEKALRTVGTSSELLTDRLPFLAEKDITELFYQEATDKTLEDKNLQAFLPFLPQEVLFNYVKRQFAQHPEVFFNELKIPFPF